MFRFLFKLLLFLGFSFLPTVFGEQGAVTLTNSNFDNIIANTELVFINFYADWCRFSNMLAPVWDEAANKVRKQFPQPGKVVIGKLDCDSETTIAARFHITKYPTLKLLRNGQPAKREYRGQRSAEAIASFIAEQLKDPITIIDSLDDLKKIDENQKRIVIGYFDKENLPEYENFKKIAKQLKDDCHFYAGFGQSVRSMHPPNQSVIAFKSSISKEDDAFLGKITSYDELSVWATERCIPLVREITFQNAEELTEEGLPFLILFHKPEDTESIRKYMKVIESEVIDQKQSINFLTADGNQFAHPLHHLGKSGKDLPLIAIDSFRHMYLFKNFADLEVPGKLRQFVLDLHSGKLHREFHYGPDPETEAPVKPGERRIEVKNPTTPPESTFKNLGPSKNRYTILKDEL